MNGPFASVEALRDVPGIGSETVSANKAKLTVNQETHEQQACSACCGGVAESQCEPNGTL